MDGPCGGGGGGNCHWALWLVTPGGGRRWSLVAGLSCSAGLGWGGVEALGAGWCVSGSLLGFFCGLACFSFFFLPPGLRGRWLVEGGVWFQGETGSWLVGLGGEEEPLLLSLCYALLT